MRLIDDSPAFFLTLCFVVVYAVVGVEAAMWMTSSLVFVGLTFVLIALVAGGICAWMVRLLDDGAITATVATPPAAELEAEQAQPAALRPAPKASGRLAHV